MKLNLRKYFPAVTKYSNSCNPIQIFLYKLVKISPSFFYLNLFDLRHIKHGVQGLQVFDFCVLPINDKHTKQT